MTDRYSLLDKNPKLSEKVFGLEYGLLNNLLKKVQLLHESKLNENPISKRGLKANFTFENQFLMTLEYLKSYQTFEVLGFSYGIYESYANHCYHKILKLLFEVIGLKNPKKISYKKVKKPLLTLLVSPLNDRLKINKNITTHTKKPYSKISNHYK